MQLLSPSVPHVGLPLPLSQVSSAAVQMPWFSATQVPCWQVVPPLQVVPHVPQWLLSVCRFVQVPPQQVVPPAQVEAQVLLALQIRHWPLGQGPWHVPPQVSESPQFLVVQSGVQQLPLAQTWVTLQHRPLQQTGSGPQLSPWQTQVPFLHTGVVPLQVVVHDPQCWGSVCWFTQVPLQNVCSLFSHWQLPPTQCEETDGHEVPHDPQW